MKKTRPVFNSSLDPVTSSLPDDIARNIGRIVSRHSYMEWVLGQVLYGLMEISIKQGRAVVRRPQPRQYAAAVEGLYAFHKLPGKVNFERLASAVEKADAALDTLLHSVFMRDGERKSSPLYLVRGSWSVGADLEAISQDAWPETPVADAAFMAKLRDDVEDAVARAEKLRETTDRLLRKSHEQRRTNPGLNRRSR